MLIGSVLDSWKVASSKDIEQRGLAACAVSSASNISGIPATVVGASAGIAHSSTSLRWTVLLPPHSGIVTLVGIDQSAGVCVVDVVVCS